MLTEVIKSLKITKDITSNTYKELARVHSIFIEQINISEEQQNK